MKRGTPMKRVGFARQPFGPGRDARVVAEVDGKVLIEETIATGPGTPYVKVHRGTYSGGTTGPAIPKDPRLECPHLLLMARNVLRPCLIRSPQCPAPISLVQCCACHGNSSIYNKGGHHKAHDFFTVWGCSRCHTWLDESNTASGEERQEAFVAALPRQITEWVRIALDPSTSQADYNAVAWALHHLTERGYAKKQTPA